MIEGSLLGKRPRKGDGEEVVGHGRTTAGWKEERGLGRWSSEWFKSVGEEEVAGHGESTAGGQREGRGVPGDGLQVLGV